MRPKLPELNQAKRMQVSRFTICRLVEELAYRQQGYLEPRRIMSSKAKRQPSLDMQTLASV